MLEVPILILLAGALLAALGARLRFRYTPVVQAVTVALALASLAWSGSNLRTTVLLAWRPVSLFGMPIVLSVDGHAQALGLALLVPVLAASLRWTVQPDESQTYPAVLLATGAVMLGVVSAGNLLTLALAWGFLDVACCVALLAQAGPPPGGANARLPEMVIGINGIATIFVWVTAIFLEQDSLSPYWPLMILSPTVQALLGAAAALRLGLYILYARSLPGQGRASQPILLILMPMLAGAALWIRLAAIQAIPTDLIWVWAGLTGALLAGVLAWTHPEAQPSLAYTATGYGVLLIVAGRGVQMPAAGLTLGAVTWLLGIYGLAASAALKAHSAREGQTGRLARLSSFALHHLWKLPAFLAIAALLGLPATTGWTYRAGLHAGLSGVRWLWWGLTVLAEILLAGAALRYIFLAQPTGAPSDQGEAESMYKELAWRLIPFVSLGVATVPLVVWGLWPGLLFGSQARALEISGVSSQALDARSWVGWGLPAAGVAALLAIQSSGKLEAGFRRWWAYAAGACQMANDALSLTWLYNLVMNGLRRLARVIGSLAALTEGKAALVWMLLFLMLALLYWREPTR